MRTATTIEASGGKDAVEFAVEAERLGLDVCWVAEAWGADAPSPLGYLAARTEPLRRRPNAGHSGPHRRVVQAQSSSTSVKRSFTPPVASSMTLPTNAPASAVVTASLAAS